LNKDIWNVTEQRFKKDGYECSRTVRFLFQEEDLLAVIVVPHCDKCTKCMNTYYFANEIIIYRKEETVPENISDLLELSKKYQINRPFVW
jgi:hypothetical protein